jgi:hypothetical protein
MSDAEPPDWLSLARGEVLVRLHVVPRARVPGIVGPAAGRLRVKVAAAPADGQANGEVVTLVARIAGLPRSAVALTRGATHREKTLRVATTDPGAVAARLRAAVAACASGGQTIN